MKYKTLPQIYAAGIKINESLNIVLAFNSQPQHIHEISFKKNIWRTHNYAPI